MKLLLKTLNIFYLLIILNLLFYKSQAQTYCTPPSSNCATFRNYSIDSVSFLTINNASSCSATGYTDYTSTVTNPTVNAGSLVNIYLKLGASTLTKYVVLAVDANDNGNFEFSETQELGSGANFVSGIVRIPFNTLVGNIRMRIRVSDSYTGLCNAIVYGETEDYGLNVGSSTSPGPFFSLYVKANATGLNNGTSWTDAFTLVPNAFNFAKAGDTVKIAKGTYSSAIVVAPSKDSIIVWGGYPNTGNPGNAQRNWAINQTIFNGANSTYGIFPGGVSTYTQFNGIILENASLNLAGSPQITNCVFRNNNVGSGQPNAASSISCTSGTPIISNCIFLNSNPTGYGRTVNCQTNSSPVFVNCIFAGHNGRTVIFSNNSSPKLLNCVFLNNIMSSGYSGDPITSTGTVVCQANSNLTVANSIFFGNKYGFSQSADSSDFVLSASNINISNTITQGYRYANNILLGKYPKFIDSSNIAGADGFYFTNDDGLQLLNPCSIGINAGNNAAIAGYSIDMLGNPRIFQSVVDLGAYEVQSNLLPLPTVLYVNETATGLNNGTSWANAYTRLQSAMQACSDTIKVAKGIYYPSNTNIKDFFWMENNRIILGGYPNTGNPGNAQRDFVLNPTNLSGNLPNAGGNKSYTIIWGTNVDSTSIIDGVVVRDAVNNFNSPAGAGVVFNKYGNGIFRNTIFRNNTSGILNGGAMLIKDSSNPRFFDCIIDSNGAINNNSNSDYGAVSNLSYSKPLFKRCNFKNNATYQTSSSPYFGGAIYNNNSSPVIDSCTFTRNIANNFGGAIASFNNSVPIIKNSIFRENIAKDGGAHLFNENSSPVVNNSIFFDTAYTGAGGGIYNVAATTPSFTKCEFTILKTNGIICVNNNSSPLFSKCVFAKAYGSGTSLLNINYSSPVYINCIASVVTPAVSNGNYVSTFMSNQKSFPTIINSTIVNHLASQSVNVIINSDSSKLTLSNSILWNNVNINPNEINNAGGGLPSTTVSNNSISQVHGVVGQNGMLTGIDPKFIDITNPLGVDGKWFTADDGLRLCPCSPAINTGSNASIAGYTTDVLDNPRIASAIVDMGAYEYQATAVPVSKTYFVKASASGANDGSTWTNAYTNLQSAMLNPCADTIKIARGIYKPALTSRDSTFNVNRGLTIMGGYPETGNPTEANRNVNLYPTILSGDIGIQLDSTDNTRNVVWIHVPDTSVTIDGIIIERGVANGNGAVINGFPNDRFGGGLLATQNKKLKIYNCVFRNNYGFTGGGLFTFSDIVEIDKCIFTDNNASNGGGMNEQSNNAKIKNSVFIRNTANLGGGVYCNTNGIFENSLFYKNKAQTGAGVYLENNPAAKFTNCNFVLNNALSYGFGIGLYNMTPFIQTTSNPKIRNSIFYNNTYNGLPTGYQYSDWVWVNGVNSGGVHYPMDVQFSAVTTSPPSVSNNIGENTVIFKNVASAVGNDNIWFTADDGLIPALCSNTYNKGDNSSVSTIPLDIMDSARIGNGVVDMGAYEYKKAIVNIVATDTLICPGTSVTFTATVINGSPGTVYLWYLNGSPVGTNSNTYTSAALNNNDTVSVRLISTDPACISFSDTSYSNRIIIRVTSILIPSVSIVSSSTTICSGSQVIFTATAVSGGASPVFQWKVNGTNAGLNSNTFNTSSLQNNDIVSVELTSSLSCANPQTVSSNSIQITVNATPVTSVSISATSTSICAGTAVIFTAVPVNGGSNPMYQWKINGVNAGSNSNVFSTSALNNNDIITVLMSSSLTCASAVVSNIITMTVNGIVTPAVTVSASGTTICTGSSVTFTATPSNGGSLPQYQWQVNGNNAGTNSPVFISSILNNNDQVRVILTSSANCLSQPVANSNIVTMSVGNPVSPQVSITGTATVICAGSAITFTATPVNGGTNPLYQWKINNINAGTNNNVFTTTSLQNNDLITCVMTVDPTMACVTANNSVSNALQISVNAALQPTASVIASDNVICRGRTVVFTATPINAGTMPSYFWKLNGNAVGGNSSVYSSSTLNDGDQISCLVTAPNSMCTLPSILSNIIVMSVNSAPVVTITPVPQPVIAGSSIQINAMATGTGNTYIWTPSNLLISANILSPVTKPLDSTTIFSIRVTNAGGCSATASVKISVNTLLALPSAFTPNGDGKNDVFRIPAGVSFQLIDFSIYDRSGFRVFTTNDINKGWDGKYKGNPFNTGGFIYIIRGTERGNQVLLKGNFVLIR